MRNVLMISPHFPPDSTAATHRVRLLAPHLARYGWQPTVLTVDPRDYEGRLDPDRVQSALVGVRPSGSRSSPSRTSSSPTPMVRAARMNASRRSTERS